MKYSYASIGMVLFGLISFVVVVVFQDITINNEADYYSLKEAMEASMYEAIDIAYYRDTASDDTYGEIKIIEEKFVANFTRRFINNTMGNSNGYVIEFYDIMEKPPKASIIIRNKTNGMVIADSFDVVNNLTGIIEAKVPKSNSSFVCDEGEELKTDIFEREYIVNLVVRNEIEYHFYQLNLDTVKDGIKNERGINNIKSIWINSIEFGPDDMRTEYDISPAMQSASYLKERAVDSTDIPVIWNTVNSRDDTEKKWFSSCMNTYKKIPDFDITVVDSDGAVHGVPIIRILKSNSDDIIECDQIFTYRINWEYGYCSSG